MTDDLVFHTRKKERNRIFKIQIKCQNNQLFFSDYIICMPLNMNECFDANCVLTNNIPSHT